MIASARNFLRSLVTSCGSPTRDPDRPTARHGLSSAVSGRRFWRRGLLSFAAALFLLPGASLAIEHEVRILMDLDEDPSTGCSVVTVDGPFDGVEQILITTLDTTSPPEAGTVTDAALSDCVDPVSDSFGPPASFDGGWPVGIANGVGGRDVVETYFPLVSSLVPDVRVLRLGVVVLDELGGEEALLTRDDTPGGAAIILDLRSVVEIPTLGEWGMLLLALLIVTASFVMLGRRGTVTLGLVLIVLVAGAAWAAGSLDGLVGDWSASDELASNGIVLFGKEGSGEICFRVDVDLAFNTAPTADPQAVTTDEETPVAIVLAGSDPEGDPLTFTIVPGTGPTNGTVTGTPPNVTYTPNPDYEGPDAFDFQVEDPSGTTDTATVSITVTGVNDAPVVDPAAFSVPEDATVGTSVGTATFTDPDAGQSHTFAITAGNTGGAFAIDASTGEITVASALDFETLAAYSLTLEVTDDGAPVLSGSATIDVTVTDADDPPAAVDDAATVTEDDPATTIDVLANDTDVDGGPMAVESVTQPADGTVVITNGGADLTYQPDADYCNDGTPTDDFTYTLNGGSTAVVSVTVTCVDDDPVAVDDVATVTEDDPATTIDVLANDTDVDGGPISIDSVTQPANGTVVITGGGTGLTYQPDVDYCNDGSPLDTFTYTLAPGGSTATVSVTVTCVNDAPVANAQAVTTDEDVPVVITLTGSDVDGDALTFAIATGPANGTLGAVTPIDATSAQVTYTPAADFNGADNFTFTVNDGTVSSPAATVSITVEPVQDPPTANAQAVATDEDVPVAITLTGSDIDGNSLTFAIATGPANGTLGAITQLTPTSAEVTYTPNPNFFGSDSFTFTVNDGTVSSAAATVSITVNSVPDPPLAGNDAFNTVGNVELAVAEAGDGSTASGPAFVSTTGNVLNNDSDPVEGSGITIVELQGDTVAPFTGTTTQGGSVTLLADGSFVYTPEAGDRNVVDSFTYVIQNGVGAQATGTVQLTIVDELLWFVKNTDSGGTLRAAGLGDGTSSDPFSSLSDPGTTNDAEDVSVAGESILVFLGDGSSSNQDQGITLEANQKLFGHSTASLSLGGLTVQTPSPGARPKIDNVNAAGDGVTITDATGVEVTGLDISGTDNAVQIRSAIAGTFTASIHDNTISSAGGHGIDGRTTAGELRLALDANTGITAGGSGVLLDGTGGGSLFVTSFGGNGVDGATAADGLSANGVIFDADPTTPGFEEVVAGATVIGSSVDPVAGDGLKLTSVKGNLNFTQLDVFNSGGVGIQVVGDTSGGTGFELSAAAGQVESTGDSHGILLTDVGIDPGDDFLLTRIDSTGSVRGVELLRVLGGDFSIVDGGAASGLTSSGEAIRVEGGTSAVTFDGVSATRTTVGGAAISGFNHDGSFLMTGGTIIHTGGRVIDFDDMDGGSDFTGTTVGTSNHHGERLVNSAGTHTFPAVVITTAPPAGVDALHLENNTGTTNVGGLSVTTNGSRGLFASSAGTLNLIGATNQIATTGHSAVEMANTTIGGSGVTFASISASSTGTNAGIDLDNVAGATFQVTGTVTVNTTGGTAAGIDGAGSSAPLTISAVDVDATAGAGIALTNNSGTVTINGGDVNAATGVAFDVNGGSGNVTYGGTIRNTVDNAVEITGRATAGRTVSLSNNITHDNGSGGATNHIGIEVSGNSAGSTVFSGASKVIKSGTQNGVHLVSNPGHTIQFTSGGLDIDTTSGIGFNATGGGTVEAAGAGSSITTATGVAVNVVGTNIGGGDLTFQSVTAGTGASGPANGILLNGTGTLGGLRVTGTGAAGSGGTIQRTGGVGILLTSTQHVSLSSMNVQNAGDDGIRGQGVHNFELIGSNLTTNGNATAENGLQFGEASGTVAGITGTLTITNTNITGSAGNNVHIRNTSGTLAAMNVSGSTFNDLNDVTGANSFLFEMSGTATTTAASITSSTFSNNSPQRALEVQAHQSGTISGFTVSGSTFNDNGIHASFTQDTNANLTFSMLSNNMQLADPLHAINVFSSSTSTGGSITGTIEGNVIGDAGTAQSGARGNGIRAFIQGRTAAVLRIHDNTLRQIWDTTNAARGIDLQFVGPTAGGQPITQSDVTVTNNDVDTMAPASSFPTGAIYLAADDQASPARVRAHITGNTAVNSVGGGSYDYPTFDGNGAHLIFHEVGGAAEGQLVDTAPASVDATAELTSTNTGTVFTQGIALIPGPITTP